MNCKKENTSTAHQQSHVHEEISTMSWCIKKNGDIGKTMDHMSFETLGFAYHRDIDNKITYTLH